MSRAVFEWKEKRGECMIECLGTDSQFTFSLLALLLGASTSLKVLLRRA